MPTQLFTRRDIAWGLAACFPALRLARTALASAAMPSRQDPDQGISHEAEAIHQEVAFTANGARVYAAIMDDKQFTKVTGLPAEIGRDAGSPFSLFGGKIKGRNVELVPSERIVQAWRSEGWGRGTYSIARFEFLAQGSGTKLVFDHTGFPKGLAAQLATGWKEHYWGPLGRFLA